MNDNTAEIAGLLAQLAILMAQQPSPTVPEPRPASDDGPAFIPVPEAAVLLGISRASAYRYAAAGLLPVKRFGRRVYVIRACLKDVTIPDPVVDSEADKRESA